MEEDELMVHVWFATSTDPIHHMKKMGRTIWTVCMFGSMSNAMIPIARK